jgi:hypothetical protein
MLEARERVLNADAQGGEAFVVLATLRSDSGSDAIRIQLRSAPASLDAIIRRVCHVSQQEQPRLQEDRAREVQSSRF